MLCAISYGLVMTSPLVPAIWAYAKYAWDRHGTLADQVGLLLLVALAGCWFGGQTVWFAWDRARQSQRHDLLTQLGVYPPPDEDLERN